jgi:hypothetical protein
MKGSVAMDYKIIFIPKISDTFTFEREYETQEQAEAAMTAIADYTLMLHECSIMPDYSNCGMVYRKNGRSEWVEIGEDGEEL